MPSVSLSALFDRSVLESNRSRADVCQLIVLSFSCCLMPVGGFVCASHNFTVMVGRGEGVVLAVSAEHMGVVTGVLVAFRRLVVDSFGGVSSGEDGGLAASTEH